MFKRIVIYFLLLNFLNTVFFCNNEPEDYLFGKEEAIQKGEINSVVEYVVEECLDIEDYTPEDEDDDFDDPFKTEKADKCYTASFEVEYKFTAVFFDRLKFVVDPTSNLIVNFSEILSPPPKQA